jgi:hypothetical protein
MARIAGLRIGMLHCNMLSLSLSLSLGVGLGLYLLLGMLLLGKRLLLALHHSHLVRKLHIMHWPRNTDSAHGIGAAGCLHCGKLLSGDLVAGKVHWHAALLLLLLLLLLLKHVLLAKTIL